MSLHMRPLLLVLAAIYFLPLVCAASYHNDGQVGASAVAVADEDEYIIHVDQGQVVDANLSYDSSQGLAYLDVFEHRNDAALSLVDAATCARPGVSPLVGGSQTLHFVAPRTAFYSVYVVGFVVPATLSYSLDFSVDGTEPTVTMSENLVLNTEPPFRIACGALP